MRSREGCVHNQEAVRLFLEVERARAARQRHPVMVAVVSMRPGRLPWGDDVATGIFVALWKGLREVDVVGWLREQRTAGAVLTAGAQPPTPLAARAIARRLRDTIRQCTSAQVAESVRVRVIQVLPE